MPAAAGGGTWRDQPGVSKVGCIVNKSCWASFAQLYRCVRLYRQTCAGAEQRQGCGPGDESTLLGRGRALDLCYDEPSCGYRHSNSPFLGDPPEPPIPVWKAGPTLPFAVAFPALRRSHLRGPTTAFPPPRSWSPRCLLFSLHQDVLCEEKRGAGLRGCGLHTSSSFRTAGCCSEPLPTPCCSPSLRGNRVQASITSLP